MGQLLLHVPHLLGTLALKGAKILEDGGALCGVPFESFRRLATTMSTPPFSRPRDMLHLHFFGDDMLKRVKKEKLRTLLSALRHFKANDFVSRVGKYLKQSTERNIKSPRRR